METISPRRASITQRISFPPPETVPLSIAGPHVLRRTAVTTYDIKFNIALSF
jgi:hypothetical protein